VASVHETASRQASQSLGDMNRLLAQSEALVSARIDAEAQWTRQQHGERLEQLAGLLRSELGALRQDEAARGEAAVQRLGELQTALATHLATLGTALEAPMTRLMQTAAEVPQAAAGVITQLRAELSHITERDTPGAAGTHRRDGAGQHAAAGHAAARRATSAPPSRRWPRPQPP
jgi:hypothetical protein